MNKQIRTVEDELKAIEDFETKTQQVIKIIESKVDNYTFAAIVFVIGGVLAIIFPVISYASGKGYAELNLLGDYAGGVIASMWSLAGVIFIYVAFLGQKQQIMQQQIELRYAQGESKITRLEIKEQRFENTFFLLLQSQNEILKLMDYKSGKNEIISRGRDCFRTFYSQFSRRCDNIREDRYREKNGLPDGTDLSNYAPYAVYSLTISFAEVCSCYVKMYEEREGDLGHYFRNIYNIIKFVNDAEEILNKDKYFHLIMSQLSSYETIHLYYYARCHMAPSDFAMIINKYNLLKFVNSDLMIDPAHAKEAYFIRFGANEHNSI